MIEVFYNLSILKQIFVCALIVNELGIIKYEYNLPTTKKKKTTNARIFKKKRACWRTRSFKAKTAERQASASALTKMSAVFVRIRRRGFQKKPLIILVSSKIFKKATERNRLKRRVKAIMRPHMKGEKQNYKIVLTGEAAKISFAELKKEITAQASSKHGESI